MVENQKPKQEMKDEGVNFVLAYREWNLIAIYLSKLLIIKVNDATTTTVPTYKTKGEFRFGSSRVQLNSTTSGIPLYNPGFTSPVHFPSVKGTNGGFNPGGSGLV
jgi:hypothetical protein